MSNRFKGFLMLGFVFGMLVPQLRHAGYRLDPIDNFLLSLTLWTTAGLSVSLVLYGLDAAWRRLGKRLKTQPDEPMTEEEYRRRTKALIPDKIRIRMIVGMVVGTALAFNPTTAESLLLDSVAESVLVWSALGAVSGLVFHFLQQAFRWVFSIKKKEYKNSPPLTTDA